MLFRKFLRPASEAERPADDAPRAAKATEAETATVRRIVARLEALPASEARYLAAFAYIMSRAAHADMQVSPAETKAMERYVVEHGGLDEAQAVVVVEMARLQAHLHGATEDYLVTREFARLATEEQKLALLRCCFAVGAADESISAEEAAVVGQIAKELDLSRDQLTAVRAEFQESLSAMQALRRLNRPDQPGG